MQPAPRAFCELSGNAGTPGKSLTPSMWSTVFLFGAQQGEFPRGGGTALGAASGDVFLPE